MIATYPDFAKLEIRAGTIIEVADFPQARKPAYKLSIDFGPLGVKNSSAQITERYTKEQLSGMQICAVTNFSPKQIGPFISEVLTLGFPDATGAVVLITPTFSVPNGAQLY